MLTSIFTNGLRRTAAAAGLVLALAAGSAQAGDYMMPMPPAPEPEFCFDQNLRSFDVYGGYKSVDFDNRWEDDKDGWAAGIGINLYFNRYVGVGAEGYFFDSGDDLSFSTAGNLLLRIPIDALCLAPYGLIGGGYQFGDYDQSFWQAGLGLEWKLNQYVGLFGDARMIFTDEDADTQFYRAGLRFNF
jgi:hypothetical protein